MNIERTSSSNLRQKKFTRRKNKILDSFHNLQVYRTQTTISVIFFLMYHGEIFLKHYPQFIIKKHQVILIYN